MIICGYPGIGKTCNAKPENKTIDLDSSDFWIDGSKDPEWFIIYGSIAENLSRQGYIVFVSSHGAVRNYLEDSPEAVYAIVPSLNLKDQWIKKLLDRYKKTDETGDYKAWKRAQYHYEEDVNDMMNAKNVVVIEKMGYSLMDIVDLLRRSERHEPVPEA